MGTHLLCSLGCNRYRVIHFMPGEIGYFGENERYWRYKENTNKETKYYDLEIYFLLLGIECHKETQSGAFMLSLPPS